MTKPTSQSFNSLYGPWAVVTGASAGLGAEFATQLAAAGLSVVLVARRLRELEALSAELKRTHDVQTRVIRADLSTERGRRRVLRRTARLDVGLLVNNAGVEQFGGFLNPAGPPPCPLIALNIAAPAALAHAFGARFVARTAREPTRRAGLLFLGSRSRRASPFLASYVASKAFIGELSVALRAELRPLRVDVTVAEPGLTQSEMSDRLNDRVPPARRAWMPQPLPAQDCVRTSLKALVDGRARWTPGIGARASTLLLGLTPESWRVGLIKIGMVWAADPQFLQQR